METGQILRTPGGTSLAVLQPVSEGEGEGAVDKDILPTPGTRPGKPMDFNLDTDWTPDDKADMVWVNLTDLLPIYSIARCHAKHYHLHKIEFSTVDTIIC